MPLHSTAGFGPSLAPQAVPPLRRLLRPPSRAVLQPRGYPSSQLPTILVAMSRTSAAFPGAPGPPGPGHGAEPARGPAGGHPSWTQRRARAQLHALDPSPWGLGEPPKPLWASFYLIVIEWKVGSGVGVEGFFGFLSDITGVLPALPFICLVFTEHLVYTRHRW